MIFTFIQLLIMFITVYLCVYSLIDRVLKCIEHCATAKAYGKFREAGIMTKMEAVEENIIKSTKEKDNVEKGSWVEAIFAKEKPKVEKVRMRFEDENDLKRNDDLLDPDEDEDEDAPEIEDHYNDPDEDDDAFDDDKLTEESYRTTFEDPENLGLDDAEDVADDDY